jgi:hypothetical protein
VGGWVDYFTKGNIAPSVWMGDRIGQRAAAQLPWFHVATLVKMLKDPCSTNGAPRRP